MKMAFKICLYLCLFWVSCKNQSETKNLTNTEGTQFKLVSRRSRIKLNELDYTSSQKPFNKDELAIFLDTLKQHPSDFYQRCVLKDQYPNFEAPFYEPKEYLTLNDYYALFQDEYFYSYHGVHPFYLIAYKELPIFTQFFVKHRNDYSEAIYLIHMSNEGKTRFYDVIWMEGGDGGDYYRTKPLKLNESMVMFTDTAGYYDGNEMDEPEELVVQSTISFNSNGSVKSRKEKTLKNNYKKNH